MASKILFLCRSTNDDLSTFDRTRDKNIINDGFYWQEEGGKFANCNHSATGCRKRNKGGDLVLPLPPRALLFLFHSFASTSLCSEALVRYLINERFGRLLRGRQLQQVH
jgi:hypothetical protein